MNPATPDATLVVIVNARIPVRDKRGQPVLALGAELALQQRLVR